jgi:hypothetical protein
MHSRRRGRFCEAILFHRGLDLIGQDLLNSLFLTFAKYPLFGQKFIEGRPDLSFLVQSHLAYLLHAFQCQFQILGGSLPSLLDKTMQEHHPPGGYGKDNARRELLRTVDRLFSVPFLGPRNWYRIEKEPAIWQLRTGK